MGKWPMSTKFWPQKGASTYLEMHLTDAMEYMKFQKQFHYLADRPFLVRFLPKTAYSQNFKNIPFMGKWPMSTKFWPQKSESMYLEMHLTDAMEYMKFQKQFHYMPDGLFLVNFSPKRTHDLVVKARNSQYRGPVFKTTGWLQGRLSLLSFQGR